MILTALYAGSKTGVSSGEGKRKKPTHSTSGGGSQKLRPKVWLIPSMSREASQGTKMERAQAGGSGPGHDVGYMGNDKSQGLPEHRNLSKAWLLEPWKGLIRPVFNMSIVSHQRSIIN